MFLKFASDCWRTNAEKCILYIHHSETFFTTIGHGEVSEPVYMYCRVKQTATVKVCHGWWKPMRTRAYSCWHGVTSCLSQLSLNNLGPAALATESCSTQAAHSGNETIWTYPHSLYGPQILLESNFNQLYHCFTKLWLGYFTIYFTKL